jgi:RNA polymerase sigma-70 factor (family 1)
LPDVLLYDEKALLAKIAAGDEKAFEEFFSLYKERFYAVALKMTRLDHVAEELVQDVFLNIWQKRETLADIDNPSSYFFTALYRRVYNHYRIMARERKSLEVASKTSGSVNTTDDMVLAHESQQLISLAITKLPPQQQLVFRLSKQEGLRRDEIAGKLQISPHTVKNQLADALKFIKAFLTHSNLTILIISWFL